MARIVNFFDQAASSTTPTIGNIVASNLIQYANDAAYEAAEAGAPTTGNLYYNTTDNTIRYYDGTQWRQVARNVDVVANASDIADIRTTTGTADGDTNMGTYTGSTISDNQSTKQNIQELETAVESNDTDIAGNASDIADIRTTTGTSDGDTDMGSYTGGILTANQSTKANIQEMSDFIEALPSGLDFQGTWDADTNTPSLASSPGVGASGEYYIVSVAGSTNLDGITDWAVGDWAIVSSTGVWQKIDNSANVTSVNGQTGTVVLDTADIAEDPANLYYTEARVDANASVVANTAKVSADGSVDTHSDVDTTTVAPTDGQALIWNNGDSEWQPGDVASGWTYTSQSGAYSAAVEEFVSADGTGGAFTVTLPAASGNEGKRIGVKKIDNSDNAITIDGNGAETIDDNATIDLTKQHDAIILICTGTNWEIQSKHVDRAFGQVFVSSTVAWPFAAGAWGDFTSVSLTPGTWKVSGTVGYFTNPTAAVTTLGCALTFTAGNSTTGMVTGQNREFVSPANVSFASAASFVNEYVFTLTTTTTIYLKGRLSVIPAGGLRGPYAMTFERIDY